MGRLIDADALLKKMNDKGVQITFDLPVEEILGEDVDIDDFAMLMQDAIQAYRNMVIGTIREQPTAYDVEKVEEQIEEMFGVDPMYYGTEARWAVDKAIDIVKRGGVE